MIKLILSDLDDTLIPMGAKCASVRARSAIHKVLDAGIHFGPVSGRLPSAMDWMFPDDPACFATGAFCNGQIAYIDGKIIYTKTLPSDPMRKVRDILDESASAALLVYNVENNDLTYVTKKPKQLEACGLMHTLPGIKASFADDFYDGDPVKVNVFCPSSREKQTELKDMLNQEVPELQFVFPSNHVPIIDVMPKEWSKGKAVLKMAEALDVDISEVAVFGDSENDLAMMRDVPNSVAVANACADVKAAARWHIGASADESVAAALEQIAECAAYGELPVFLKDS